jgi:glucokinase
MGFEKEIKEEVGIIGIFLDGESLRIGKVMNEKIVSSSSKIIDNLGSEEIIISEIISAISEIIDEDVLGIGIGVPSVVDVKEGIVYNPVNIPAWLEVHLKEILEQKFLIPVVVNNDANCFAIGQKHFGKAKNYKNIVGLFVGVGLGAGIIIENKLYSGDNSAAGEFGMMRNRRSYHSRLPSF